MEEHKETPEEKADRQFGLVWRIAIAAGVLIWALTCGAVEVIEALKR